MVNLYQHQKLALSYLRLYPNFALFMEQGCGKTLPCLCRICELRKQKRLGSALVIAPKAAMGAWFRDIELFDEADQKLLRNCITVVNYEAVWRKTQLDVVWKRSKKYSPNYRSEYDREWDCIVLDESHKIKNRTSLQSKMAHYLSLSAHYRFILTGTPISNGSLEDIWSQYAFLAPCEGRRGTIYSKIFEGSYYDFLDKYAYLNQWHQPYKYKSVDELQDIISSYSYRVTKEECLDLPEKLPDDIYDIELLEPKIYKELVKESTIESMELLAENPLSRMNKLRQVCSGFVITPVEQEDGHFEDEVHELKCEKLQALEDFLDGWSKKLVIFAEFKHSIAGISALLTKLKIKHLILDGNQKDKSVWRIFQSDKSVQVIICQYQSGNAGIDLYAADTTIYYEPTLSSTILEQSKDRTHRNGQKEKCSYIHFITKGTIEEKIYRALQNYMDFNDKLFNEYVAEYQKGISYKGGSKK